MCGRGSGMAGRCVCGRGSGCVGVVAGKSVCVCGVARSGCVDGWYGGAVGGWVVGRAMGMWVVRRGRGMGGMAWQGRGWCGVAGAWVVRKGTGRE